MRLQPWKVQKKRFALDLVDRRGRHGSRAAKVGTVMIDVVQRCESIVVKSRPTLIHESIYSMAIGKHGDNGPSGARRRAPRYGKGAL